MQEATSRANMMKYELKFSNISDDELVRRAQEPHELPNIHGYVPIGTDPDTAEALAALYRSHSIMVIEAFSNCKERMFWHHFTSFHGTLTVPVQKLFAHRNLAAWIQACDWLMYQKMIQYTSKCALSVLPDRVMACFRNVAAKLVTHLGHTFQTQQQHVRDAKIGPAIVFAGLIERLLRVNETAHAAANMLTNDANRDQMWHDWVLHVRPTRVVESSLPGTGYQRCLRILGTEIRHLLGPLRTLEYAGMKPIYRETLHEPVRTYSGPKDSSADSGTPQTILDRWTNWFHMLPSLFTRADARDLIYCAGAVGNAALRDITVAQALSFGSWWVTKTWFDEMMLWEAEKGGFLEHTPETMGMRERPESVPEVGFPLDDVSEIFDGSRPGTAARESIDPPTRFGSMDVSNGFARDQSRGVSLPYQETNFRSDSHPPPAAAIRQKHREQLMEVGGGHNPDDSGIVLDMENDDVGKDHYSGFVAEGGNLASDPADVVVC